MITLKRATPEAIRYACLNFHYAKSVPSASYAYNVYNQEKEWCGVIIFGTGANKSIAKPFNMVQGEVYELVRVALNGKQPCTSECVAASLKQLHKDAPQIKIVVSYADADQEHIGTIYQATNWIYLGLTDKGDTSSFIVNGRKMHRKSVYSKGWTQNETWLRKHVDPNAKALITKGKRKYIWVYDKKLRKEWQKKALPYPKKVTEDGEQSEQS